MTPKQRIKSMIRFAIESAEFHRRGLYVSGKSQVRAKKVRLASDMISATAHLEIYTHGNRTEVKGQQYNIAGLYAWTEALEKHE